MEQERRSSSILSFERRIAKTSHWHIAFENHGLGNISYVHDTKESKAASRLACLWYPCMILSSHEKHPCSSEVPNPFSLSCSYALT
jgi:hypothetical protein